MSEAINESEMAENPINFLPFDNQREWLEKKCTEGRRPRKMSEVIREIIDDAMHADGALDMKANA